MDRRVKERLVGASILVAVIVLIVPELLSGPPGSAPAPGAPRLPVSTSEPVRNVTVDLATSRTPAPETVPAEAPASSAQPPEAGSADAASAAAGADASTGTGGNAAPPADTRLADTRLPNTPSADVPPADVRSADVPPVVTPPKAARSSASLETAAPAPTSVSAAKPVKPAKPALAGRAWAVQLGSFASRANADKLARQLKAQGFSVYVASGGSGPHLRYRVRIGPMADRGAATQAVAKLKAVGQTASLVPPAP